jgi:hypothetical protein
MIRIRFLCTKALYWHEPEDGKPGFLNEDLWFGDRYGTIVFKANKDYPALYMYDPDDPGWFYLIAIAKDARSAFKIYRVHILTEQLRYFLTEHHPRKLTQVGYPVQN